MKNNIWIACGGTGGHLYPGLAVAEELARRGNQTRVIVSQKSIDRAVLDHFPTVVAESVPMIGWTGWKTPRVVSFLSRYLKTRKQLNALAKQEAPTLVLAMGGFTSLVPLEIGKRLGVPCLIHDSNVMPGKVTRMWASRVDRILLGWKEAMEHLSQEKTQYTGTPLRDGLIKLDRKEAAKRLGLDPARKTLLIMGGSQGAQSLNELMIDGLPFFAKYRDSWQFVHLTGPDHFERCERAYAPYGMVCKVLPYLHEIHEAYSLADLIVSRAGAASLTEIAAFGLPSVLVPFPYAADDHQTANARIFADAGAAVMCDQPERTPNARGVFAALIIDIMENDARRRRMAQGVAGLFRDKAAKAVADVVDEFHEMRSKALSVKV
jgi:UDP-N-acetylglucosamine--N-acetylmuramyl-(pentapeptide) pyrophosphoryl-undecaprenol N-acetylglucosamine transferase